MDPSESLGIPNPVGLIPVRCYTCNRVIGRCDVEEKYHEWIKEQEKWKSKRETALLTYLLKDARLSDKKENPASRMGVRRRTRSQTRMKRCADTVHVNANENKSGIKPPPTLLQYLKWNPSRFCCGRSLISSMSGSEFRSQGRYRYY